MKNGTKLLILIIALALLLFGVTAAVYQHSYQAYRSHVIKSSESWGIHVREMVRKNFAFVNEDMNLFGEVIRSKLHFRKDEDHRGVDDNLLSRRFISFFENTYGFKFYEKISLTRLDGEIIASSDGSRGNYSKEDWWQEAFKIGRTYRFIVDENGRALLLIALRQDDINGDKGILVGLCYISAIVRDLGLNLNEHNVTKLDLLTDDGRLLYSTGLHRASGQLELPSRQTGEESATIWIERKTDIQLLIPSPPGVDTPVGWQILISFSREKLFSPIITMRWWIASGFVSLIFLGVLLFFLIRRIQSKQLEEEQLLHHQRLLEAILDGIKAGMVFIDKETLTITRASEVAGEMLGVSPDSLVGKNCYQYICRFGKTFPEGGCPAMGKDIIQAEFELERPDGTKVPIAKTVLELSINNRPHFVAVMFDITYRKEIERQLAHALKLESIGSLAAGIAHEINTPAQYINDNLKFINRAYNSCVASWEELNGLKDVPTLQGDNDLNFYLSEVPVAIKQSLEGVEHITTTVQALKKLSHPGNCLMEKNDINALLSNISIVCRNEWKYSAKLEMNLDDSIPSVMYNSHDIGQVFLNLIINAAYAVNEKYGKEMEQGVIILSTFARGDEVVITLEDDGIGIPYELQQRVFDPFFTTKGVGKGTGQGLSICHTIIEKHNGLIQLKSDPGEGTKITISLPIENNGRD